MTINKPLRATTPLPGAVRGASFKTSPRHQRGALRVWMLWALALLALLAYALWWPVPIRPLAWQAPADRGYVGAHATNTKLAGLTQWPLGAGQAGPEDIVAHQGQVYTALSNGDIVRVGAEGQVSVVTNTGGRPLGLAITPAGQMFVADALKGLLSVNLSERQPRPRPLLSEVDHPISNDPLRYADAVAIDRQGVVWLTDATRRFSVQQHGGTFEASVLDILEHSCTGRILVYDPSTRRNRVALDGLCFPNGLAFTRDGKHLLVSETGAMRILKVDLARLSVTRSTQGMSSVPVLQNAIDQGAAQVLIDNLPGYPDNLTVGQNGRIWTGLTKPRSPLIDASDDKPWLRSMMLRLPRALWPVPKAYGHVIAFDEQGRILDDLQDPTGAYPETTAATEVNGRLFVQSLNARTVGWMPYPVKP